MTAVCPPGLERVPGFGEQHYQAGSANCSGSCLFLAQYGFCNEHNGFAPERSSGAGFSSRMFPSVSRFPFALLMRVFTECVLFR